MYLGHSSSEMWPDYTHRKSSQWEASISNRKFYPRVSSDAELEFAKKGDKQQLERSPAVGTRNLQKKRVAFGFRLEVRVREDVKLKVEQIHNIL